MNNKFLIPVIFFMIGFVVQPFVYNSFNELDTRNLLPLDMIDYEMYSLGQIKYAEKILIANGYDKDLASSYAYYRESTKGYIKPSNVTIFPKDYFNIIIPDDIGVGKISDFFYRGLDIQVSVSEEYENKTVEVIIINDKLEMSFANVTDFNPYLWMN